MNLQCSLFLPGVSQKIREYCSIVLDVLAQTKIKQIFNTKLLCIRILAKKKKLTELILIRIYYVEFEHSLVGSVLLIAC